MGRAAEIRPEEIARERVRLVELVEDLVSRPPLLLRKVDPGAIGQGAQRLGERELVQLHHEREDVPSLAAAEAMPDLPVRRHREGGCFLRVEGTEPLVRAPGAPQGDALPDELDDVRRIPDPLACLFSHPWCVHSVSYSSVTMVTPVPPSRSSPSWNSFTVG